MSDVEVLKGSLLQAHEQIKGLNKVVTAHKGFIDELTTSILNVRSNYAILQDAYNRLNQQKVESESKVKTLQDEVAKLNEELKKYSQSEAA